MKGIFGDGMPSASEDMNEKQALNLTNSQNFPNQQRNPVNEDVSDHFSHLSKAMESLSVEERTMALNDIHGVAELNEEDDLFLDKKLAEMESQIERIGYKNAYETAKQSSLSYVSNRDFRLMFLRSVEFDSAMAAKRFVTHFQCKLDMFGVETLGRDICLNDLGQLDMIALLSGFHQYLEHRDR